MTGLDYTTGALIARLYGETGSILTMKLPWDAENCLMFRLMHEAVLRLLPFYLAKKENFEKTPNFSIMFFKFIKN